MGHPRFELSASHEHLLRGFRARSRVPFRVPLLRDSIKGSIRVQGLGRVGLMVIVLVSGVVS